MSAPTRFPLAWPAHRPRTKARDRRRGQSSMKHGDKTVKVSLAKACIRLEDEILRLGGLNALLSMNVELRLDGVPRADQRTAESDPGTAVYFTIKGEPYTLACDTFDQVSQNVAALANHIEATRRITSYGVATAAETLQAFLALPAPGPAVTPWWRTLGLVSADALEFIPPSSRPALIDSLYKTQAKDLHPDRGGSPEAMSELNAARDEALGLFGFKG